VGIGTRLTFRELRQFDGLGVELAPVPAITGMRPATCCTVVSITRNVPRR
jgi:hypothetical protein